MEISVPNHRVRAANEKDVNEDGEFVVYWMTAFRRLRYNFSLQLARDYACELKKPLVILEALRVGYPWASDRLHRFVLEGMADNRAHSDSTSATHYAYVESEKQAGQGLIESLSQKAAVVVTDDYPCFFIPRMIRVAARLVSCKFLAVDSNCLMPLAHAERTFTVAHSYRRWMQKELPKFLEEFPEPDPLKKKLPKLRESSLQPFFKQWPEADLDQLRAPDGLRSLPIDHSVTPTEIHGGAVEAGNFLSRFIKQRLQSYNTDRNEPDQYGSSEMSPHLHFGHISPHEVFHRVMEVEGWTPARLNKPNGKVNGFWGVSENAEAFLDQLCSWREIGFNMCWREPGYERLDSLPDWTQKTIHAHADDPREYIYSLEQFELAETHDEIWNAAQRQLVTEGRIHNYLRMLWGKKILHWTANVEDALAIMVELNNKYALDGRDPNSYSGIFWVLGRYDRAWGPERPIFGKIRYMTSENTAKKHKLGKYLQRYSLKLKQN
ncbi:MAG: deoxyribodipyrimidine photolyase [Pirellulaceae bacterium]